MLPRLREVAPRHENAHGKSSLQLLSFSDPLSIIFYEHFYQVLLSDITAMAKSDLSSFLCPSFIYFGLINGLYTDLELILTGFSFFFFCTTKWTSPFISGWK